MLEDEGGPFFVPYEYIVWLQNVTITSDTLSDLYSDAFALAGLQTTNARHLGGWTHPQENYA